MAFPLINPAGTSMMGLMAPDDPMAGLLAPQDKRAALIQALMRAGAAGLQSGGWSDRPVTLGQTLGNMTNAGLDAYNQGLQTATQRALMKRQLQKQDKQESIADADRMREARLRQMFPKAFNQDGSINPSAIQEIARVSPSSAAQLAGMLPKTETEWQFVADYKLPDGTTQAGYVSPTQGFRPIGERITAQPDPSVRLGIEDKLRDDYRVETKPFETATQAYARVQASAKDPSAAGDLSLIFNYMKVLDPGSVVRESEFATAATTGAYGERIQAAVSRIISGERLSDAMRNDFVSRAEKLYQSQKELQDNRKKFYSNLAEDAGVSPQNIFGPDPSFAPVGIQSDEFEGFEVVR